MASLSILLKKLETLPEQSGKRPTTRAWRNLDRILGIQYQVEDIMADKHTGLITLLNHASWSNARMSSRLSWCRRWEKARSLTGSETRSRELYGPKEIKVSEFSPERFVEWRIETLRPKFAHREVENRHPS